MTQPAGIADTPTLLRESDVRRIAKAVRVVEGNERNRIEAPDTMKVRAIEDLALVQNLAGEVIPQYAVVWLVELEDDLITFGAKQIEYPAVTTIGIASGAIPDGAPGYVWRSGTHPLLCSSYEDVEYRRRLSSQAGSWYAIRGELGLILHIGDVAAADQPAGLPAGVGLVRARLDKWRPI